MKGYVHLSEQDREILERTQIIPESVFRHFRAPAMPDPGQELLEDILWMVLVGSLLAVVSYLVIAALLL